MTQPMNVTLSDEEIARFEREGFLKLDAVTTQEEVEQIRQIYDELFDKKAGRDEGNQFDLAGDDADENKASLPQILSPAKYAPELLKTQLFKNIERIGKQLLGEQAEAKVAHAINKPPKHGVATPWHQDAAYWEADMIHRKVGFWVPLQEATLENGCMQFVPGSHKLEVLKHQSIGNDPRVHGLELVEEELHQTAGAVACPLPPGGCTIHGGYMLHYTAPNRSDQPRRALILEAVVPGIPRDHVKAYPWNLEKQTARDARAKQAKAGVK